MQNTACEACPFRKGNNTDPPPFAEAHAAAVIEGQFACCHVNMGDCIGAAMFRANVKHPTRFLGREVANAS